MTLTFIDDIKVYKTKLLIVIIALLKCHSGLLFIISKHTYKLSERNFLKDILWLHSFSANSCYGYYICIRSCDKLIILMVIKLTRKHFMLLLIYKPQTTTLMEKIKFKSFATSIMKDANNRWTFNGQIDVLNSLIVMSNYLLLRKKLFLVIENIIHRENWNLLWIIRIEIVQN